MESCHLSADKMTKSEDNRFVLFQSKPQRGKEVHSLRKETIERIFADAKETHGMRCTFHRSLARVILGCVLNFLL